MPSAHIRRTWAGLVILVGILALLAQGCAIDPLYRRAAESGWQRWDQDHKPVLTDAQFNMLTEGEQQKYLSTTLYNARIFERDQALRLVKD